MPTTGRIIFSTQRAANRSRIFANLIECAKDNAYLIADDIDGLALSLETIRTALGRVDTLACQLRAARRWVETVGSHE